MISAEAQQAVLAAVYGDLDVSTPEAVVDVFWATGAAGRYELHLSLMHWPTLWQSINNSDASGLVDTGALSEGIGPEGVASVEARGWSDHAPPEGSAFLAELLDEAATFDALVYDYNMPIEDLVSDFTDADATVIATLESGEKIQFTLVRNGAGMWKITEISAS